MSMQEADKIKAGLESQLEDLPVEEAQQAEVKAAAGGASGGVWKTTNFLTHN